MRSRTARLALALVVIALAGFWQWRSARVAPRPDSSALEAGRAAPADTPVQPRGNPDGRASRDLSVDESHGGHTLERHVGRTDDELRERLRRERGISAASTYTDRTTAEAIVGQAIQRDEERIRRWSQREGSRPNLVLSYDGTKDRPIGRSVRRDRRDAVTCIDAVVVLRWAGREFYVLTSYPEERR